MCNLCLSEFTFLPTESLPSATSLNNTSTKPTGHPLPKPFIPPESSSSSSNEKLSPPIEPNPILNLIATVPYPNEVGYTTLSEEDDPMDTNSWFVKVDTALGLNIPSLPRLASEYQRAWKEATGRGSMSRSQLAISTIDDVYSTIRVTFPLLLMCPDNGSAWNDRKAAITSLIEDESLLHTLILSSACKNPKHHILQILWGEIYLVDLILTKSSKAPTSWYHRTWVINQLLLVSQSHITPLDIDVDVCGPLLDILFKNMLRHELDECCTKVSAFHSKNYYSWNHRLKMITLALSDSSSSEVRLFQSII